jgi:hypothetical protein
LNPLVKTYLRQIEEATAALADTLAERREAAAIQQEARDNLQKEVWSRQKDIAVLQESASDYADLKEDNERRRAREAEVAERLRKVLAYTRALTEEVRR